MRNFKWLIEYDGTDFHGWQRQPGLRTVQGTIEDCAAAAFGEPVAVQGAGRTDAGVHALGQVCNFKVETAWDLARVEGAVASRLPEDIVPRGVEEVGDDFHARFSARERRYRYLIKTEPTAVWRRFSHVLRYPVDLERMRSAAERLVGEKDFASFTPVRSCDIPTVCDLRELSIEREGETITAYFRADHFLHHMVRSIMGTLIEVGRGRLDPERMSDILCRRNRAAAGPTLPPNGLFLVEVAYGE